MLLFLALGAIGSDAAGAYEPAPVAEVGTAVVCDMGDGIVTTTEAGQTIAPAFCEVRDPVPAGVTDTAPIETAPIGAVALFGTGEPHRSNGLDLGERSVVRLAPGLRRGVRRSRPGGPAAGPTDPAPSHARLVNGDVVEQVEHPSSGGRTPRSGHWIHDHHPEHLTLSPRTPPHVPPDVPPARTAGRHAARNGPTGRRLGGHGRCGRLGVQPRPGRPPPPPASLRSSAPTSR